MTTLRIRLGRFLIRLGGRLAPPIPPRAWRHWRVIRRSDVIHPSAYGLGFYTINDFAAIAFAKAPNIDRFAIADDGFGTVCVRTLGQRFTLEEITAMEQYRIVGTIWQFEDEAGIYARVPSTEGVAP